MICVFHDGISNGPGKVANNLISGLRKLNVKFKENPKDPSDQDNIVSLQMNNVLNSGLVNNSVIGPNICVIPPDNKIVMEQRYKKIIVPCKWVKNLYLKWLPEGKIIVWPVGIDTELFSDKSKYEKTNDCLVYFKRRSESDLDVIKDYLKSKNQSFEVIKYGKYKEEEFIKSIERSRYGIVIDSCESQGIAIEEMLSCNLPLFVWDVTHWEDRGEANKAPATSIPYWDERCGHSFVDKNLIDLNFQLFLSRFKKYAPRDYIVENLTLEKQAKEIKKII